MELLWNLPTHTRTKTSVFLSNSQHSLPKVPVDTDSIKIHSTFLVVSGMSQYCYTAIQHSIGDPWKTHNNILFSNDFRCFPILYPNSYDVKQYVLIPLFLFLLKIFKIVGTFFKSV